MIQKKIIVPLLVSIFLLNVIFIINNKSFLALYYIFWVIGIGSVVWKYRPGIEEFLVGLNVSPFKKFLMLGLGMVFLEEIFAGFSMHLGTAQSVGDIVVGIKQFITFNFLALPGIIIGWYLLLKKFEFTRKEIFVLTGVIGLFAEKVYIHIFFVPIMGALLILPTMFTYALILAPSVLSFRATQARKLLPKPVRYVLGFVVPILVSIPFIALLSYLKTQYPDLFPPQGFVM